MSAGLAARCVLRRGCSASLEIDADNRIVAERRVRPDDIDAAIEELDARYLAGEAAAYAHTWSVIAGLRRVQPTRTPSDDGGLGQYRPPSGHAFAPGDADRIHSCDRGTPPDVSIYIEAVHRLSEPRSSRHPGGHGTSQEGFDAEWRGITLSTFEGDLINRCEIFDEADLDAALARFDELDGRLPLRLQAFDASADHTNSVVQPVFSALPELHLVGRDAVPAPVRRHRHLLLSRRSDPSPRPVDRPARRATRSAADWCDAHAPNCEPRGRLFQ